MLQTFLARKLLKHVNPPKGSKRKSMRWQLSSKGIQKIAALKAIATPANSETN
jgi:hypothetical protein